MGVHAVNDSFATARLPFLSLSLLYSRGEIKAEGWLVLTTNSLSFYDRDPNRMIRKPLSSFALNSHDRAFVILSSIEKRYFPYASPSKQLPLAFGIEQHSSSGLERAVFVANSLQSKIEWVEAIENTIAKQSQAAQATKRELKSVSVVPIRRPSQTSTPLKGEDSENLDLSITSSMLDSPSSVI